MHADLRERVVCFSPSSPETATRLCLGKACSVALSVSAGGLVLHREVRQKLKQPQAERQEACAQTSHVTRLPDSLVEPSHTDRHGPPWQVVLAKP